MKDIKKEISDLQSRYAQIQKTLNLEKQATRLKELEALSTDPALWENQEKARKLMQELGQVKDLLQEVSDIGKNISDMDTLVGDDSLSKELIKEVKKTKKELESLHIKSFLSGTYDAKDALLTINAGQGGTEAMDWVSMLLRMYLRYSEKREWKTETLDINEGEEAGIKSVTIKVDGPNAYGFLKNEIGTHRLVRQSPFNADNLRQTSFASVEVLPEIADIDAPDIEIKDEDLKWQFFRSSTQGGQNVQKVSTAVRVTHTPTGISVTSQTQRFQEQNRKIALDLLRSRLWLLKQEERKAQVDKLKGEYKPASWGYQIRSYVLHPYKMVKDLRTGVESTDAQSVLDGDIDKFIEASLVKTGTL